MTPQLRHYLAVFAGLIPALFFLIFNPLGLDVHGSRVAAVGVLMIIWWVAEALPMAVVSLLPLVLFPLLGIAKIDETAMPYANPIIYLFFGGFMIGLAIEKWNLHKRIALNIVRITGTSGDRIILGFMVATGFLSMWLSNTATTMMMFPIAMSVIKVMEDTHKDEKTGNLNNLAVCLLLSIAYASNLGGIGTIIGTAPNAIYVGFLEKNYHYTFDFREWMMLCTPIAWVLIACLYILLVKVLYPNRIPASNATKEVISEELKSLGRVTAPERRVLIVFVLTVTLWITRDALNQPGLQSWILSVIRGKAVVGETFFKLDDTMIAMFGAILLFTIPAHSPDHEHTHLLEWKDTSKMAWGILFLFGGGITLATQLEKAGLMDMLGHWVASFSTGGFWLIFVVALLSIFISEVMSNTAQVIVFAPVVAGIAAALHMNPLQLGMAMTLGACCAGMLPMGTPPNAIVFASGRLKLKHMTTTGFIMNILATVLISVFCWYLLPMLVHAIV